MEILEQKPVNSVYKFPSIIDSAEHIINALEDMTIEKCLNCSTEKKRKLQTSIKGTWKTVKVLSYISIEYINKGEKHKQYLKIYW